MILLPLGAGSLSIILRAIYAAVPAAMVTELASWGLPTKVLRTCLTDSRALWGIF